MIRFARAGAVSAAFATLLVAGCSGSGPTDGKTADAAAGDKEPISSELKTDRDKVSYMIGMDMGRGLAQVKDDVDIKVVERAIEDSIAGDKTLMTPEQALEVRKDFMKKRQEKLAAERKAAAEKNKKEGKEFLAANKDKPGVKTTASGLQYIVEKEGTGPKPAATDTVKVNYVGTKIDGTEFDSSYKRNQPATFPLNGVIKGWGEGLQLMPVGSKYKFFVPADLAYGERGPAKIGPNATLIFEVELLGIEDAKAKAAIAPAPGTAMKPMARPDRIGPATKPATPAKPAPKRG
jgi:FKBP-type peptidyl-prolyl cis-trans isomerase